MTIWKIWLIHLMLSVKYSSKFKKDYKLLLKRKYPVQELFKVIDLLRKEIPLPEKYHDHLLSGDWQGFRECHIRPDWLLIYYIEKDELRLALSRTGTHSDLFKM